MYLKKKKEIMQKKFLFSKTEHSKDFFLGIHGFKNKLLDYTHHSIFMDSCMWEKFLWF